MASNDITQLLDKHRQGDPDALAQLMPAVYEELHQIASARLRGATGQTLSPTVLVNEAYLRLAGSSVPIRAEDRVHFFAIAARSMRNVLVDRARAHSAAKRGGAQAFVTLDTSHHEREVQSDEILRLDSALEALREKDPLLHQIVELRFFAGLHQSEIATVIGKSERTVKREWAIARAWLLRELRGTEDDDA